MKPNAGGPSQSFDRDILKCLKGATREQPIDLVRILWGVDARQRLVLTHDELEGALRRLIDSGLVAEAAPLHFFVPTEPQHRRFSGLSSSDYENAVKAYRSVFAPAAAEVEALDGQDPGRELVVVRWRAADGESIAENDEDQAEQLADRIEAVIPPVADAEILGFEQDASTIDILIWGEGSNQEIDRIYAAVAPIFREFRCPSGSCLIRLYDGGKRELLSDQVAPQSPDS